MSLVTLENEQYRRDILMALQADADFSMNNLLLNRFLASIGNPISHDRLTQQLNWLQDQGLITLETAENNVLLAKLTASGQDVALCRTHAAGIARPALS